MALASLATVRVACGICALFGLAALSGCEGTFGTSPPHAAPPNPRAEGEEGRVDLFWGEVPGASNYVILWDDNSGEPTYDNVINGIEALQYSHTGLTDLRTYHYKIVAETSGGRGPESRAVEATPGPVPGPVEWVAVTAQDPGHTIYFAPAADATHYRVYFAGLESQLSGRRPLAAFEEADASPHVREDVTLTSGIYYRVVAMNDTRIGIGGPVAVSPAFVISEHELPLAGAAFGHVNVDDCLDLITANGGSVAGGGCTPTYTARVLADVGLGDLIAAPRKFGDGRLADFNGDRLDDIFSNTRSSAASEVSIALLHVNQGDSEFLTSPSVSALGIAGFGGTLLAADFDNDGDIDVFAPYDQTRGDGARNWLLINDGTGAFTDTAAAAGLETNPPGEAYVPRGGQAVDFDEDGYVDLLFGSRLMLNNGDGTFSDGSAASNLPVIADQGLRLTDTDLDGDLDLLHHDGIVTRLFRNAGGVFDGGEQVGAETEATYGNGLTVCDINGDGFEDALVARNLESTNRGTPKILVNVNGSLLLSATQEGTAADENALRAHNEQLACGDQNGDELSDVIARWGEHYRLMRGPNTLSRNIRLRVVGVGGDRNQQGRVVRVASLDEPQRVMTRVVESGSGLRSQGMYDLLVGAPWPGEYEVTVRFGDGVVTTTAEAGDGLIIYRDGRVEDIDPEDEE
jgi:hypothetical protein